MVFRILPTGRVERGLVLSTFVNTLGYGSYVTTAVLFLTRWAGLSPADVSLGLMVAGICWMCVSTPAGHLADRIDARRMLLVLQVGQAICTVSVLVVRSTPVFVVVASLAALCDAGRNSARGALIARGVKKEEQVRARAYLRVASNLGISLGGLMGGLALAQGTRSASAAVLLVTAGAYVAACAALLSVPPAAPSSERPPDRSRMIALRDRPFLAYTLLDGVLSIHYLLLEFALPIWVVRHTDAPRWMVATLLVTNTLAVVLLQVPVSRGATTAYAASRAALRASLFLGCACLLFGLAEGRAMVVAAALLVAGALVHVVGELQHAVSGWTISFGLAPGWLQGQYQGTYALGRQLAAALGPAVLVVVMDHGFVGWSALAALLVVTGLAVPAVVEHAMRHRPYDPESEPTELDRSGV